MPQQRVKRGATLRDISATAFNRLVELQKDQLGNQPFESTPTRSTYMIGRNDCGYDLEPGAPVLLGAYTGETTTFGNWKSGWVSLNPCYLPINATEANALVSDLFRVAIAWEAIPNGELGRVTIAGVAECKVTNTGSGWICPLRKAQAYTTSSQTNATFGFARKLCDTITGYALCELNSSSNFIRYDLTQAMQVPASVTTADLAGLGTGMFVQDTQSCAQWQANGDAGICSWFGSRFVVTTPWCVA